MTVTPVVGIPFPTYPLSNITPFTYQDGYTFLELIESFRQWVNDVIVPQLNADLALMVQNDAAALVSQTAAYNTALASLNGVVTANTADITAQMATLTTNYSTELAALVAAGNTNQANLQALFNTFALTATDAQIGAYVSSGTSATNAAVESLISAQAVNDSKIYGRVFYPETYGGVGDGITDDTVALGLTLAALTPGSTLVIPAGKTYLHSNVLTIAANGVRALGGGTLKATVPTAMTLVITGSNVTIENIHLLSAPTARTGADNGSAALYLSACDRATVRNVFIDGASTVGIIVVGATNFVLDGNDVRNTYADGIHITAGSSGGVCTHNTVTNSGDDGFSIVSYTADPATCTNIVCTDFRLISQTSGRGMSVVGGNNIRYSDFVIETSSAAAIYVASESVSFNTRDTTNAVIARGTILNANTNATIDHGAIFVFADTGKTIDTVIIDDITIRDTRATASFNVTATASTGTTNKLDIGNVRMFGTIGLYAGALATGTTNSQYTNIQLPPSTTAARLAATHAEMGVWYFDETLMLPLYWFTGNIWQDGAGVAR